jgi:hypothetical protein
VNINIDRLRAVLEFLTAHPELYRADVVAERTTDGIVGDLALWTVVREGSEPRFRPGSGLTDVIQNGQMIWDEARYVLGMDCDRSGDVVADRLFSEDNTLADLWRIACELTDGAIEVPANLGGESC